MKKLIALLLLLPLLAHAGSFNGSGTFVRSYNWTQDAQNGIPIQASRFDTEDNGFASGLSSVMTLNGQSTVTANLPMSGFYFTNVGNAIAPTNFAAAGQVQNNEFNYGMENGSSLNTYVVGNGNVIPTALQSGQMVWFKPPLTNTASSTLNWDALGAKSILKNGTTALSAGDLVSGTWYGVTFDSAVNAFVPITPVGNTSAPSWYNILNIPTMVQNVSNSGNVSLTSLQLSGTLAVSGTAAFLSTISVLGGVNATGVVTASTVSATAAVNTVALSATTISLAGSAVVSNSFIVAKVEFDASASPTTLNRPINVSSVLVQSTGVFLLQGTFPPFVVPHCMSNSGSTAQGIKLLGTPTTTSLTLYFFNTTTGSAQVSGVTYAACSFD